MSTQNIIQVPFTQRSRSATLKIIPLKKQSLKYDKMKHTLEKSAHFRYLYREPRVRIPAERIPFLNLFSHG